jgi:hypothetical protein
MRNITIYLAEFVLIVPTSHTTIAHVLLPRTDLCLDKMSAARQTSKSWKLVWTGILALHPASVIIPQGSKTASLLQNTIHPKVTNRGTLRAIHILNTAFSHNNQDTHNPHISSARSTSCISGVSHMYCESSAFESNTANIPI